VCTNLANIGSSGHSILFKDIGAIEVYNYYY